MAVTSPDNFDYSTLFDPIVPERPMTQGPSLARPGQRGGWGPPDLLRPGGVADINRPVPGAITPENPTGARLSASELMQRRMALNSPESLSPKIRATKMAQIAAEKGQVTAREEAERKAAAEKAKQEHELELAGEAQRIANMGRLEEQKAKAEEAGKEREFLGSQAGLARTQEIEVKKVETAGRIAEIVATGAATQATDLAKITAEYKEKAKLAKDAKDVEAEQAWNAAYYATVGEIAAKLAGSGGATAASDARSFLEKEFMEAKPKTAKARPVPGTPESDQRYDKVMELLKNPKLTASDKAKLEIEKKQYDEELKHQYEQE